MFFTHNSLLHTNMFTHKHFYTHTLLHTDASSQKHFYTQTLLHTEAFTHKHVYTQTLQHTWRDSHNFTANFSRLNVFFVRIGLPRTLKSQFYSNSYRSSLILCELGCRGHLKIAILLQFLPNLISCEEGCTDQGRMSKSQFPLSFGRSSLISCERLAADTSKSEFHPSFCRSNLISC